jgi:hypothetical protein
MLKTQLPHKYPPIRICTRRTSARDAPAPPNRKTKPTKAVIVLLILYLIPSATRGRRFAGRALL